MFEIRSHAARLVVAAMSAVGAAGLGGCSSPTPHHVTLVVGARANMPATVLDEQVVSVIDAAALGGGSLSVVVSDGQPSIGFSQNLSPQPGTSAQQKKAAQTLVADVLAEVAAQRADEPESDVLEAIAAAARSMQGSAGDRTIIVLDSGLSTTGAMQFQDGLLNVAGADLAKQLTDRQVKLDLTGVNVTWVGLGDTSLPQQPLPLPARDSLQDIWTHIIEDNGGRVTFTGRQSAATPPDPTLPAVTPVPIDAVPPLTGALAPAPGETVAVLRDSTVGFLPNSSELRDPSAAVAAITPIAQAALSNGWRLRVTGTTSSWGTEDGRLTLSTARAETVRNMLIQAGVPAADITTEGVGTHFAEYLPDRTPDGGLDEVAAAQNRSVRITQG